MTALLLQVQVQIPEMPPVFVSTAPPTEIIVLAIIAVTVILWLVAELEERMEFAERVLARQGERARLGSDQGR